MVLLAEGDAYVEELPILAASTIGAAEKDRTLEDTVCDAPADGELVKADELTTETTTEDGMLEVVAMRVLEGVTLVVILASTGALDEDTFAKLAGASINDGIAT